MRSRRFKRLDNRDLLKSKRLVQWFLTFLKSGNTFDYMKNLQKLMMQKTNRNIPRRNKYILEDIFKFYILKYFIKFLQNHDNSKKNNSAFIISRNTG